MSNSFHFKEMGQEQTQTRRDALGDSTTAALLPGELWTPSPKTLIAEAKCSPLFCITDVGGCRKIIEKLLIPLYEGIKPDEGPGPGPGPGSSLSLCKAAQILQQGPAGDHDSLKSNQYGRGQRISREAAAAAPPLNVGNSC